MNGYDEEEEKWSHTTTNDSMVAEVRFEQYKLDPSKIETLADVVLILDAMDLHVPSNNPKFDAIEHLLTQVK